MPTTGLTQLPDVGELSYNGVTFSSLNKTNLNGKSLPDNAKRTIKAKEWTLEVEGIVTLESGQTTTDNTMLSIRRRLDAQAGQLTYRGRGFGPAIINKPGGTLNDVMWGPIPTTLHFQPLGGGLSAIVKWVVVFTIPEIALKLGPLLQFNEETSVSYDERCFSTISIKGTMEIPLTRVAQFNRTIVRTVDEYRPRMMSQIAAGIDLRRFRVTRRNFEVSRDKRTMEWDFAAEELPSMGLPFGCSVARGTFSFKPKKTGLGGLGTAQWICSLRGTYTVVNGWPRRTAWIHFLSLLQYRMSQSATGQVPGLVNNTAAGQNAQPGQNGIVDVLANVVGGLAAMPPVQAAQADLLGMQAANRAARNQVWKAFLIDFGGDEGLYLDSDTMTFHASWLLFSSLSSILTATGLWRDGGTTNRDAWNVVMQRFEGWRGSLDNRLDPTQETIVDLGVRI